MVSSLSYMLATLKLLKVLQPNGPQTTHEESALRYKRAFFALSIASTVGLILFFMKHRFLCHDLGRFRSDLSRLSCQTSVGGATVYILIFFPTAFSWFALCEYIVASANMGFHCTTMLDFPTEDFLIAKNTERYRKKQAALSWKLD